MDTRIAAVEAGLTDLRLTLGRVEATLAGLATKADVVKVEGIGNTLDAKITALDTRVGRVETNVGTALTTAVGKAIGPGQFIAIIASAVTVFAAGITAYAWLSHQPWFPH